MKDKLKKVDDHHIKEHGKTFHSSLVDGIRCYTDSCTTEDGLTIKGWAFSEGSPIKNIRARVMGQTEPLKSMYLTLFRSDVNKFYMDIFKKKKIGFELTHLEPNVKVGDTIYLECNTSKEKTYKVFETVKVKPEIKVNDNTPGLTVIEDFYNDPYAVRELALQQDFQPSGYHKGKRTSFKWFAPGTIEKIESALGLKITDWDNQPHNTVFQYCTPADPLVYHYDGQTHAAVEVGKDGVKDEQHKSDLENTFIGAKHDDFLDGTKWEEIDRIGNKFNRFAMWDAKTIHAATKYFGTSKETGRLFHMFFFNAK